MSCPELEQLEQFVAGILDAKLQENIQAHLSSCSACQAQISQLRDNQRVLEQLDCVQPQSAECTIETAQAIGHQVEVQAPTSEEPPEVKPGSALSIEGYEMVRELHRGGQGVVYEALQRSTKRKVAVKILLAGPYASKSARRRFEREIELVAQLKHPNIISIFDSGSTKEGLPYFAMDYIRGRPLHDFVREKKLSLEEALKLFSTVCEAVQYAHQRGVIHRDLKPSNIIVDAEGHPRVLDFGLAKLLAGPIETIVTVTQDVIGTLPYMSPEQAGGSPEEVDTRTDVYSLGVILYELLTGHFPYPVVGKMGDILKHIAETPPTPPTQNWTSDSGVSSRSQKRLRLGECPIDDDVQTIILKALSKERERRYQSAGEVARDIGHYLKDDPIEARRDSGWYIASKVFRKHRFAITLSGAFVTAVFAVSVWLSILYSEAESLRGAADRDRMEALAARDGEQLQRLRAEKTQELALSEAARARRESALQRRTSYDLRIALVELARKEGNVTRMREQLQQCPSDLRGWEWYYLRLVHGIPAGGRSGEVEVSALAFDSGSNFMAVSCGSSLQLWSVKTLTRLWERKEHELSVNCVAFTPDGQLVASGSNEIVLWNVETGKRVLTLAQLHVSILSMDFSFDGGLLVSAASDNTVKIWDVESGTVLRALDGHKETITRVAFSPNGKRIASGSSDGAVKIWEVATGEELLAITAEMPGQYHTFVEFTADGERLVTAGARTISVWDAANGERLINIRAAEELQCVAVNFDGSRCISGGARSGLTLWDLTTGRDILSLNIGEKEALSPLGGAGGRPIVLMPEEYPVSAAFSPKGRWIATGTTLGQIIQWDGPSDADLAARIGQSGSKEVVSDTALAVANSVDNGLAWLAAQQLDDGSFGALSHYGAHVGITALAGLAFLAEGNTLDRGRYAQEVDGCLRFIHSCQQESGLIASDNASHGSMYGHSFATLFLASVYKHRTHKDIGNTLRTAVNLIVSSQNEHGGWRYQPESDDADVSVTSCQLMALCAARDVGMLSEMEVIDRAVSFITRCQTEDGGFQYMLNSSRSAFGRSAAATAALEYAGGPMSEVTRRGLEYLDRFNPRTCRDRIGHYFYGHYYAALAQFWAGEERSEQWWSAISDTLVERQDKAGFWRGQAGTEYGTAIALIVLQMPQRLLPIIPESS